MTALDRIQLSEAPNEFVILIGPRKNPLLTAFLTVCVSAWTLGCVGAVYAVIWGHKDRLFIGVWLCLALVFEFVCLSAWLWNSFGLEKIVASSTTFVHRRILFGRVLTTKSIRCSDILKIRTDEPFGTVLFSKPQLNFTTGTILIDYRWDFFSFGYQLEEAEAVAIVESLGSMCQPHIQEALRADSV